MQGLSEASGGVESCVRVERAPTSERKDSSPMQRFWWSSHTITCVCRMRRREARSSSRRLGGLASVYERRSTLLGGYRGLRPPPTSARILHRKSISTIPMPPLGKSATTKES